jgi:hypothetical protein
MFFGEIQKRVKIEGSREEGGGRRGFTLYPPPFFLAV